MENMKKIDGEANQTSKWNFYIGNAISAIYARRIKQTF